MCSGGAVPRCIVELTGYYLALVLKQACSECPVCFKELEEIQKLLRRISRGEVDTAAVEEAKNLAARAYETAACGVGRIGAEIVAEALANYGDEIAAHVQERYCPAGVCDIRYVVEA
ncbi:MAG: NADH-ubiquinone oxidoreductase-F iron-sulfur binding region domain-containing protein [Bacillota bacterium]